jgi:hypothetical protein
LQNSASSAAYSPSTPGHTVLRMLDEVKDWSSQNNASSAELVEQNSTSSAAYDSSMLLSSSETVRCSLNPKATALMERRSLEA